MNEKENKIRKLEQEVELLNRYMRMNAENNLKLAQSLKAAQDQISQLISITGTIAEILRGLNYEQ